MVYLTSTILIEPPIKKFDFFPTAIESTTILVMHTYDISVQEPWFTHIRDGQKTIEGRLMRGRFAAIRPGDIIRFASEMQLCEVRVTHVEAYYSFWTMLWSKGIDRCLPGLTSLWDGVGIYRKFYSVWEEVSHGAIAIEFVRINI